MPTPIKPPVVPAPIVVPVPTFVVPIPVPIRVVLPILTSPHPPLPRPHLSSNSTLGAEEYSPGKIISTLNR